MRSYCRSVLSHLKQHHQQAPIHVVLWEDNSMLPTDCSFFSMHEPLRMDLSSIRRWRLLVCIRTAQH